LHRAPFRLPAWLRPRDKWCKRKEPCLYPRRCFHDAGRAQTDLPIGIHGPQANRPQHTPAVRFPVAGRSPGWRIVGCEKPCVRFAFPCLGSLPAASGTEPASSVDGRGGGCASGFRGPVTFPLRLLADALRCQGTNAAGIAGLQRRCQGMPP
jgi:hypothetical protein